MKPEKRVLELSSSLNTMCREKINRNAFLYITFCEKTCGVFVWGDSNKNMPTFLKQSTDYTTD